ncbi:hypothetical protein [Bradyrhizobium sp. Ash2021]|uniref:hypothetical protein n=1 Tax=Bradyrhizobium sp. Ash2021 TaxID=2954771 RepID=UPI002814F0CA|nr:hypothetical protein [Bradyrhizobium sp. Ash2021]WMT73541.1 hypothetical protein NL528_37270 [Bradyrhizobium sp. Ash2021]
MSENKVVYLDQVRLCRYAEKLDCTIIVDDIQRRLPPASGRESIALAALVKLLTLAVNTALDERDSGDLR